MNYIVLGYDVLVGQKLQYVQKFWMWFGVYFIKDVVYIFEFGSGGILVRVVLRDFEKYYLLVGCMVVFVFEVVDFEFVNCEEMVVKYLYVQVIVEYFIYL